MARAIIARLTPPRNAGILIKDVKTDRPIARGCKKSYTGKTGFARAEEGIGCLLT